MVHQASRHASADGNGFFADQFENLSNYRAHLQTGREILEQTYGKLDAFVCGAGTGGTLAGVSYELKRWCRKIRTYLVDPPGSSLLLKVFLLAKELFCACTYALATAGGMVAGTILLPDPVQSEECSAPSVPRDVACLGLLWRLGYEDQNAPGAESLLCYMQRLQPRKGKSTARHVLAKGTGNSSPENARCA
jgi:hypothetical protein